MSIITFFLIAMGVVVVSTIVINICLFRNEGKIDKRLISQGFSITRTAGSLRVDDKSKKWCINDMRHNPTIYNFSDMVDCKISENSILNKVNSLGVYLYTRNGSALYIALINAETKRDSFSYSSSLSAANQIVAVAQSIILSSNEKSLDIPNIAEKSIPCDIGNVEEQLRQLKQMVDSGLITEQDFEAKKRQLLGL